MSNHLPNPEEFCREAEFRSFGDKRIEARLRGELYDVRPYGDDCVQVVKRTGKELVAILTIRDGHFVPAGGENNGG